MSTCSPDLVALPTNSILLVSPCIEDHVSLESIFRGSRWNLVGACTASDGLRIIHRHHSNIPVVICEHRLPDGDWKLVLGEMDKAEDPPSLIVCSRLADERLWVEVLNFGAFDLLLSAPFVPEEVLRVTESAWSARNRTARPMAVPREASEHALSLPHSGQSALAAGSCI